MRVASFEGRFDDLGPFVELLRSTGLLDSMLCVGWSCIIPVSAWHVLFVVSDRCSLPSTQISLPSKVLMRTGCLEPIISCLPICSPLVVVLCLIRVVQFHGSPTLF